LFTYSIDHLGSLIKSLGNISRVLSEIKLHRTKSTALIKNVISSCLLENLINDLGIDIIQWLLRAQQDNKKILCLFIRYFSESKKEITTFYQLIEIEHRNAIH